MGVWSEATTKLKGITDISATYKLILLVNKMLRKTSLKHNIGLFVIEVGPDPFTAPLYTL